MSKTFHKTILRVILVLIIVTGSVSAINAQNVALTAYAGFMYNSQIYYYLGEANVSNSASYGADVEVYIKKRISFQLLYNRCDPNVKFIEYGELKSGTFKMSIENIHTGLLMNFAYGSFKPYGSLTFGATRYHLKDLDVTDSWRFSIAPAFGTKIFINDIVGLKLQARLIVPMEFTDAKIFIETNKEDKVSNFGIPIVHADFTAGIFFVLK